MISLSGILFLVGCHELLNIFWMIRYAVFAQESATIFGDEYIVLNSDTTEIFIGLNLVEVEEFCTVTGCLPVVDEGRDEVNSRLVGYHETFLQTATHTQAVGTELLQIRAYLFVETNVNLVEVLHVVNIHSHHVAQTMAFEPSMHNSFMMTLDAKPYFNSKAVAMKIDSNMHPQNQAFNTEDNQQMIPGSDTSEEEKKVDKNSVRENIMSMMQLLKSKYNFRYNTVMKFVEYMPKEKGWYGFQPVDPRVQKRMTLEVQLADIRVSIKDVRNFLESDYIKNYNPIDEYLFQCYDKWDGKDHIRALARTVPTNNPYWADWFYTWFLGMVDQWRGFTHRQYGNSVAPLLISKQGYNKSTFCRRLLPPELQWGYNDNLILSEKRQVYQAMAQFMVINLDEFNQISPQVQQGFLKNLIQLPTLKYKPPYGSHVMEFPRLASFIATSNITDILTDPSGNRRFIGVELTGPIDVSVRPNYQQLFAQALTALHNGEKSYFDAEQVKLIMKNNCQFEVAEPIDQYFQLYFDLIESEKEGEYLTAAEIFDYLKKQIGSSLKVNSLMGFGRKLANMSELKHKRFADGMKYLVKKK